MWQYLVGGFAVGVAGYQAKKIYDKRPRVGDVVTVPISAVATLNGLALPPNLPDVTATVVSVDGNNMVTGNLAKIGQVQFRIIAIKTLVRNGKTVAL